MERKHGYSLSSYVDGLTEEGEEKLFDLCESFMATSDSNVLENDEWKIFDKEDSSMGAQLSLIYKPINIHYTVHVDIDKQFESIMDDIAEQEKKDYENHNRINNRILKAIESVKGKKFVKCLLEYLEDGGDVSGVWEIVSKPEGSYQEENYGELKGVWVDQWLNGGYVGDDFAGHIYVELKKNKYLKMYYSC